MKNQSNDPCQHLQEQFIDALYGEMSPEQKADFEARLAEQPECRQAFEEMRRTLSLIGKPEHREPGPDFWANMSERIEAALPPEQETAQRHPFPAWQAWRLPVAAAVAMLILGIGIGRWLIPDRNPLPVAAAETNPADTRIFEQTFAHFEKSKTLLQGLVNLDTENTGDGTDLSLFRNASRKLVHESIYLRSALSESKNPRLNDLVMDLEIILSQLANLEGTEDGKVVEIIRDSVDRSAIFLKINIEELYRLKQQEKQTDRKKTGQTII